MRGSGGVYGYRAGAPDLAVEIISPTQVRILTREDTLDDEDVVTGWTMPVAAPFEAADDLDG